MSQATRFPPDILISEVGPRDGLQSLSTVMPNPVKSAWIRALAEAGLREIEVGSFVSPKLLPQMAGTPDVVGDAITIEGLTVLALAPNLKGAERAVAAGVHRITVPVSASRAHGLANVNRTPEQMLEEIARMRELCNGLAPGREVGLEVGLATAFGCTMEGPISEDWVIDLANRLVSAGADQVGLSDTVGYANPVQVRRMFRRLRAEIGDKAGGAHFHNTRGQGLANVVAALDADVRTFDSSMGGIGGCPYAPGATGNIVTEDLVFLLESMGLRTGIDLDRLLAAREIVAGGLPGEALYGHLPAAGLPKGFAYAAGRA